MTPDNFDNFVTSTFNIDIPFKGRNTDYIPDEDSFYMYILGQELTTPDYG